MLTPIRFRDGDDPLLRELLASAEQDRAPSVSRARVALGLGLGALASNAAPAPPGVASGMPARLLRLRLLPQRPWGGGALQKYLFVGLATGLAVVAGFRLTAPARSDALVQLPKLSPSSAGAPRTPSSVPSAAPEPVGIELGAIEPGGTQSTSVAPQSEAARTTPLRTPAPASTVRRPARRSARVSSPVLRHSDPLLAEVAQLDRARAALRDQHAAQAISELDAYAATFPHAELALEADVLRVHALIAAREHGAAAALAGRLLDRPGSEQYRAELRRAIAATRQ